MTTLNCRASLFLVNSQYMNLAAYLSWSVEILVTYIIEPMK